MEFRARMIIPLDPHTNDLRGRRFGRLRIPRNAEPQSSHGHSYWPCVCRCGVETAVRGTRLLSGAIVSCGCARRDPAVRRAARLLTPEGRRREIAALGGAARKNNVQATCVS